MKAGLIWPRSHGVWLAWKRLSQKSCARVVISGYGSWRWFNKPRE